MKNINSLKKLVFAGALSKSLEVNDLVLDRLNYELAVIEKLNHIEYITICAKIVEICNKQSLLRSYGRGLATGSLVNYCLDITKINPITEGLIFERFLDPEFPKAAVIDIDIPMGSQKLIVDLLKIELPQYFIAYIAFIQAKPSALYKSIIINGKEYKKHLSAVIISMEKIPLELAVFEGENYYVTDNLWEDKAIFENAAFNILEMEYLKKLDLISRQVDPVNHPYNLSLTDKKTFEYLKNGDIANIFLSLASLMRMLISNFTLSAINELAVIYALCHQSQLKKIAPPFIHNKNKGYVDLFAGDKRVGIILKETYGLVIYQETYFHIMHDIAGFTYATAELYRKIFRKKNDKNDVDEFKNKFKTGCEINSGLTVNEIVQLENLILESIPFTFSKAHSLSNIIIAYWGAYYKTHFETKFDLVFNIPGNIFIKHELF